MGIREVKLLGSPVLREKSKPISNFQDSKFKSILEDLRDTFLHLRSEYGMGRAIAAPQIGYLDQVIFYNLKESSFYMINPEITYKSEKKFEVWDSCFSFKLAFFVKVNRYQEIQVKFQNESGEKQVMDVTDDLSELFQHEIDHLHGVLATDHWVSPKDILMREEWERRF